MGQVELKYLPHPVPHYWVSPVLTNLFNRLCHCAFASAQLLAWYALVASTSFEMWSPTELITSVTLFSSDLATPVISMNANAVTVIKAYSFILSIVVLSIQLLLNSCPILSCPRTCPGPPVWGPVGC